MKNFFPIFSRLFFIFLMNFLFSRFFRIFKIYFKIRRLIRFMHTNVGVGMHGAKVWHHEQTVQCTHDTVKR